MLQEIFSLSSITEDINSSGDTYVSSAIWSLEYVDNLSFSKSYSGVTTFNEENQPTSNSNEDVTNFIRPFINFSYYLLKSKSLYIQENYPSIFKWFIYEMTTIPNFEGVENFVSKISWRLNATNSQGFYSNLESQTTFNKISDSPYIDYYNLTEQNVVSWLELTENYEALKEKLNADIYDKMNPPVVILPLPWS